MRWLLALPLGVVALGAPLMTLFLVAGALRDPSASLHGVIGSAIWTTFGPHLILLNGAILLLTLLYRVFGGSTRLTLLLVSLSLPALLTTSSITGSILSATSAAGGSASLWQGLKLGAMSGERFDHTVSFIEHDGVPLRAAIYRPERTQAPVIIYIHGGGFKTGSYLETDADLRWFARAGWLVISLEYRLWTATQATWDKAPADVLCGLFWVAEQAGALGGDLSRVALLGDSAGGSLAIIAAYSLAAGEQTSECGQTRPGINAVVVQYPAVDPLAIYEHGYPVPDFEPRMLVEGYIGGDPYRLSERVDAVSAYRYLSDQAPPTLIIAPEKDGLVPPWSVYRFADYARLAGVEVELVRMPFASHVFNQIAAGSIGNQARLTITQRYLTERGLAP